MPRYVASLNSIPLDIVSFEWPIYRGTQGRYQRILVSAERWEAEFANSVEHAGNTLAFSQERLDGERGTPDVSKEYANVLVLRVTRISADFYEVILTDARYALQSFVLARTFNVRSGEGYAPSSALSASQPATFKELEDAINAGLARAGYQDISFDASDFRSRAVPDNQLTDGLPAWQALDQILQQTNLDLWVDAEGNLKLIEPGTDLDQLIDLSTALPWLESAPPLVFDQDSVLYANAPETVSANYYRRYEVEVEFNPTGTRAESSFPEPRLEQVYFYRGEWRNEQECRVHLNSLGLERAVWPSEDEIRRRYFQSIWEGTAVGELQKTAGRGADAQNRRNIGFDIVETIKRSWRTHFRVIWPDGFSLEDAPDLAPGHFDENGEVTNQAVKADWVDFLNSPAPWNGQIVVDQSRWDAEFDYGEAPFEVAYDATSSVIELKPSGNTTEVKSRVPGSLESPLVLQLYSGVQLANSNPALSGGTPSQFGDSFVVPSTENAVFKRQVRITVSFIYTLRLPTEIGDYYKREEAGPGGDGTRKLVELPVPDAPRAAYAPDDRENPLNLDDLKTDAEERAAVLLAPYEQPAGSPAESPTLSLLDEFDTIPSGVSALVISVGSQGPMYMGVRVEVDDVSRVLALRRRAAGNVPTIVVNGVTK